MTYESRTVATQLCSDALNELNSDSRWRWGVNSGLLYCAADDAPTFELADLLREMSAKYSSVLRTCSDAIWWL